MLNNLEKLVFKTRGSNEDKIFRLVFPESLNFTIPNTVAVIEYLESANVWKHFKEPIVIDAIEIVSNIDYDTGLKLVDFYTALKDVIETGAEYKSSKPYKGFPIIIGINENGKLLCFSTISDKKIELDINKINFEELSDLLFFKTAD